MPARRQCRTSAFSPINPDRPLLGLRSKAAKLSNRFSLERFVAISRIARDFSSDPVRQSHLFIWIRQFTFGQDQAGTEPHKLIDAPCAARMGDDVTNLLDNGLFAIG